MYGVWCEVQCGIREKRTIKLDPSWPRVNKGGGVVILFLVLVPITYPARVRCKVKRRMDRWASWLRLGPQQQPISQVEL